MDPLERAALAVLPGPLGPPGRRDREVWSVLRAIPGNGVLPELLGRLDLRAPLGTPARQVTWPDHLEPRAARDRPEQRDLPGFLDLPAWEVRRDLQDCLERPDQPEIRDSTARWGLRRRISAPRDSPEDLEVRVFPALRDSLDRLEQLAHRVNLVLRVSEEATALLVQLELLERRVCMPRILFTLCFW